MPLGTYKDKRSAIGATFDIDPAKFDALCSRAGLSPLVEVDVRLVDMEPVAEGEQPTQNPHGSMRALDAEHGHKWRVAVPVSDRFEFSDKAVERVNRNLLHVLRHVSQAIHFVEFAANGQIAQAMMGAAGPTLEVDAYAVERSIKEDPAMLALTPKAVTFADEPNTEESK